MRKFHAFFSSSYITRHWFDLSDRLRRNPGRAQDGEKRKKNMEENEHIRAAVFALQTLTSPPRLCDSRSLGIFLARV